MKIETVDIDDLEPYENNPRVNRASVSDIEESIKKFGFKVPLVIDESTTIIAGHTRLKAIKNLVGELDEQIEEYEDEGKENLAENLSQINEGKVPALRANDLTEEQIKEFRLVDNRIAEMSEWDETLLKFEIRELDGEMIGFSDEEMSKYLDTSVTYEDLTEDDMEKTKQEVEEHYKNLSDEKLERMKQIDCPHCDEEIYIDFDEIEGKAERLAEGED